MKRNLVVLSLAAALTLMAASGIASTSVSMCIRVPFDFYAGDQKLPAGEYSFGMGSGLLPTASVVTLRAGDGKGIWIMVTKPEIDRPSLDRLVFNRYGDKHFLSTVSIQGFKAAFKVQKHEKELRSQVQRMQNTVAVAQK